MFVCAILTFCGKQKHKLHSALSDHDCPGTIGTKEEMEEAERNTVEEKSESEVPKGKAKKNC